MIVIPRHISTTHLHICADLHDFLHLSGILQSPYRTTKKYI